MQGAAADLWQHLERNIDEASDVKSANRWVAIGHWVNIVVASMWGFRSSLAYARAHCSRLEGAAPDGVADNPTLAVAYFLKDAGYRALSGAHKAGQLLNAVCELRIVDALAAVDPFRNAHAHRFDPGIPRSEATSSSARNRWVWELVERPSSPMEELIVCERTYALLDQELTALFQQLCIV